MFAIAIRGGSSWVLLHFIKTGAIEGWQVTTVGRRIATRSNIMAGIGLRQLRRLMQPHSKGSAVACPECFKAGSGRTQ